MTVPSQTPVEVTLLPAGQTKTTLAFIFTYVDSNTISININDVDLISTAYNVVGQNITFTPPIVGISGGSTIKVYLDMKYSRDTDLLQASPIFASDLNAQLDRLTLMVQQSEYGVSKGISVPPQDSDNLNTVLPAAPLRANRALVFNPNGSVNVSEDLYTNQVGLCQQQVALAATQVSLATAQASSSLGSAALSKAWAMQLNTPVDVYYSARYYSLHSRDWAESPTDVQPGRPSAKTWAETASAIAIPNGSIQPVKLNQTGSYIFGSVNSSKVTSTVNLCSVEETPILAARQSLDRQFKVSITSDVHSIGFSNNNNTAWSYIDFPIGYIPSVITSTGISSPIVLQSDIFSHSGSTANLTFNIMGVNKTYTVSGEIILPSSGIGSVTGSISLSELGLSGKIIAARAHGTCALSQPFGTIYSLTDYSRVWATTGGATIDLTLLTNSTESSNGVVNFNITFTVQ